jgi:hypothetical protein
VLSRPVVLQIFLLLKEQEGEVRAELNPPKNEDLAIFLILEKELVDCQN